MASIKQIVYCSHIREKFIHILTEMSHLYAQKYILLD